MNALLRGLVAAFFAAAPIHAQTPPVAPPDPLLAHPADVLARLQHARGADLDTLWQGLAARHQLPFASGDSALLLYRGPARRVDWAGDVTGWQPLLHGRRVRGTDVWYAALALPTDARVDYKVVVDSTRWQLDPANPRQSWSGFGPNSELRMPGYVFPAETTWRAGIARGRLAPDTIVASPALGYRVQYRVYTPAGYENLRGLPVLYVTDGHEYADDRLGGLVTTLDNLIADGAITPLVAVFIDPRNPDSLAVNRRETQFLGNGEFVAFVADELRPAIERRYRVRTDRAGRVVMGTSFGGYFAAFLGLERPDVFARLAIQSPAFWPHPEIVARFARAPAAPYHISLSQGTLADGTGGADLAGVLAQYGYAHTFTMRPEGHAWAHWRALMPGVLRYHFGLPGSEAP